MADDLSAVLSAINKSLRGAAKVIPIAEVETPYTIRLPTGITTLDCALGGGFPAGSMHQLFGPDGAGKDYLSNLMLAEQQRIYGDETNIGWMSFGYKPDLPFMELSGVNFDVGNFTLVEPGEKEAEKPAEALLNAALKLIASGAYQLIVINELGSGETRDNVVKELGEDAKMATWASLMTEFIKKYYTIMRTPLPNGAANKTTVVMINPVRADIGGGPKKGNMPVTYSQGGGHALKHAKAVDVHLRSGKYLRKGNVKIGKEISWKVMKGKHGISEGAEGSYLFMFGTGVDLTADLISAGKAYGVLRSAGRYYVLPDGEKVDGGAAGAIAFYRENPEAADNLKKLIVEQAKTKIALDSTGDEIEVEDDGEAGD